MVKVYLSPSDQKGNYYASGDTNEMEQCGRIADACEAELNTYEDCEVINDQTNNMYDRVAKSNEWKATVHVCIHTNASTNGTNDGKVGGTRVFYYADGVEGEKISKSVFTQLAPLTTGSDKCIPYPNLYEIKNTHMPCVYIETEFHDNAIQAQWIVQNVEKIGKAIATGIAQYYNLKKKTANSTDSTPISPNTPDTKTFTLNLNKNTYDKIVINFN